MGLGKTYFENGPITLNANPKAMTNETATFSFSTFVTAQKLLALALRDKAQMGATDRKQALAYLVKFTSRTEYLLTERPFTYREWGTSFLQGDLPTTDPVAKLLMNVFNNDLIPRYYLGPGELRVD